MKIKATILGFWGKKQLFQNYIESFLFVTQHYKKNINDRALTKSMHM